MLFAHFAQGAISFMVISCSLTALMAFYLLEQCPLLARVRNASLLRTRGRCCRTSVI